MSEQGISGKKRGWGLTILIPLSIIGAALSIVTILYDLFTDDSAYVSTPVWQRIPLILNLLLAIVFLVASWRWKRWGCFGLIVLQSLSAVMILATGGQMALMLVSAFGIVFLFAAYKSKEQYFE